MTTLTVKPRSTTVTVQARDLFTPAHDWYVDNNIGLDTNAGIYPWAPFKTIAKLLTVLSTGESVGLANRSVWREQLTIPANNISVYAYGYGAAPILRASDIQPNASFTKTGGRTNVYQIDITPDWEAGKSWVNAWQDGVFLARASSVANCDATAGSYYPSSDSGTITLYIHATDSSSVITNAKVYEATIRRFGVDSYLVTGTVISGVQTDRQLHEDGSFRLGQNSSAVDVTAKDGSKHNIYVRTGTTLTSCAAVDCYYAGLSVAMFVYNDDTPANEGVTFTSCTATKTGDHTGVEGFYGHKNTSGSFGIVSFISCAAVGCSNGFNGTDATLVYTSCTVTDWHNTAFYLGSATTLTSCSWVGANVNMRAVEVVTTGAVVISGGTATFTGHPAGGYGVFAFDQNNVNLTITNWTCVGTDYGAYVGGTSTGGTIAVTGTYWNGVNRCIDTSTGGPALTSDYNHFSAAGQDNRVQSTSYADIATYQAGTGQDAHSTIG